MQQNLSAAFYNLLLIIITLYFSWLYIFPVFLKPSLFQKEIASVLVSITPKSQELYFLLLKILIIH